MILENRIESLAALGSLLDKLSDEALEDIAYRCEGQNPFFTAKNVYKAIKGIVSMLDKEALKHWVSSYDVSSKNHKVGVVMAGNIPAVGFHDALCVLISGDELYYKPSTKDTYLITYLFHELLQIAPEFEEYVHQVEMLEINDLDAIIATGSNNTARYFEQYFAKVPNIIRKGRSSCAVLTGDESEEELEGLAHDVFDYFGLGCRNVSKFYVPDDYDFRPFLKITEGKTDLLNHSKYYNNYEYHKSILLVNGVPHLDSGTVLVKRDESVASPMSVLHFETYTTQEEAYKKLKEAQDEIQCVVGQNIGFGESQQPGLADYADSIDTMLFLSKL